MFGSSFALLLALNTQNPEAAMLRHFLEKRNGKAVECYVSDAPHATVSLPHKTSLTEASKIELKNYWISPAVRAGDYDLVQYQPHSGAGTKVIAISTASVGGPNENVLVFPTSLFDEDEQINRTFTFWKVDNDRWGLSLTTQLLTFRPGWLNAKQTTKKSSSASSGMNMPQPESSGAVTTIVSLGFCGKDAKILAQNVLDKALNVLSEYAPEGTNK